MVCMCTGEVHFQLQLSMPPKMIACAQILLLFCFCKKKTYNMNGSMKKHHVNEMKDV